MKILALDSSGLVASVAVMEDDILTAEYNIQHKKTHSQTLLPMMDEIRKMINLGFTVLAMNAGLDSAILDPTNRDMMGVIYATEALLGQDDYCMEYISAYREGIFGPKKS